jgi:hypothetical protein
MTRALQDFHSSRRLRANSALVVAALLSGCGDIYLNAPRGAQVILMPTKKPAQVHDEQVVWFKWWGNEPLSEAERHAATMIERHQLTEVRIRMVNTFADGFISTFTGPVGFPRRTLVVEGNSVGSAVSAPPQKAPTADRGTP